MPQLPRLMSSFGLPLRPGCGAGARRSSECTNPAEVAPVSGVRISTNRAHADQRDLMLLVPVGYTQVRRRAQRCPTAVRRLRDALAGAARVEAGPLNLGDACGQYADDGVDVTPQLRGFLETYGVLTVIWPWGQRQEELTTDTESALDVPLRNVRIYAKRIGEPVVPIGAAFSSRAYLLPAEDDDILIAGDAGIQRVANGFENAIQAIVRGGWDKTYL
ncbi:SUKH-3 domain-containing protein [Streptomyces sp. NPDC002519]